MDAVFEQVPDAGAVVSCAAGGPLVDLATVTDEEFAAGIEAKLLGQIALVRRAVHHLPDGASITLTGGTFTSPLPHGSLGAVVNSGLEGFVRNAAAELPRGLRLNLVSPGWIRETLVAIGADGSDGTPAAEVASSYLASVDGDFSGQILAVPH